jgi:peptidoglycan/xylan/chitin deacetylase (PgdA/CDA1 family)
VTTGLMYHELQRLERPLAESAPGYLRYVLDESLFARQMAWMQSAGLEGVSLGRAHRTAFNAPGQVAITFDDGCESDWVIAAPRLLECGFGATFYVVSRWIGRRAGFLTPAQLRELASAGFEVGSHSATHAFLTDLDPAALRRELTESKDEIENMIGRPVTHLSCPGGRANRRVADGAREAGYESMATSRIGVNGPHTDRFTLARCPVLRDTTQDTFQAFCRGDRLAVLQVRARALDAAKALFGNHLYASIRNAALKTVVRNP